uniref:N-acetylgalactosaminide beta-1,3-galactosyltransferase n=1 Tax=Otus sunia TaxID=257818 RepID=A0A8C8E744_9STRI
MTGPRTLETKARHVRATWARHCNVALFMSSEPDEHFPAVGLPVREGRHQLYWKTIRAFQYVHQHHLGQADWFLKADDDTFVVVANLRWLLAGQAPEPAPHRAAAPRPLLPPVLLLPRASGEWGTPRPPPAPASPRRVVPVS